MTTEQFIWCLSMTESHNNPDSKLGDSGRAEGRFQIHPDWMDTQMRKFAIRPALNETWNTFFTRLVTAFYNWEIRNMDAVHCAMYFHMGHPTNQTNEDWDKEYADRFVDFAAQVIKSGT